MPFLSLAGFCQEKRFSEEAKENGLKYNILIDNAL